MSYITDLLNLSPSNNGEEIWKQFASENKGRYVIGEGENHDRVELIYRNQLIILDKYRYNGTGAASNLFTRIRMELNAHDDFRFKVVNQGIINTIGKYLGFQDIEIGRPEFDRRFLVQGNDKLRISTLFSNQDLMFYLLKQKDVQLELLYKEGVFHEPIAAGNCMLYFLSETIPKKTEELNDLLRMFQILFDQITLGNRATV